MQRSDLIRILAIMAAIGLVVFFVVQIARFVRGNNEVPGSTTTTDSTPSVLADYADSESAVVMTRVGVINALEDHREIRITITQEQRTIEVLQGYDGQVMTSKTYRNTPNAYSSLLRALDFKGYTDAQNTKYGDGQSVCSTGRQLIVELIDSGVQQQRLWTTSCSEDLGNFAGDPAMVRRLFEKQIPDYKAVTTGVSLN